MFSLLGRDALACCGSAVVESAAGGKAWDGVRGVWLFSDIVLVGL